MFIIKVLKRIIIIIILLLTLFCNKINVNAATVYKYGMCFDYVLTQEVSCNYTIIDQDYNIDKAFIIKANGDVETITVNLESTINKKITSINNDGYIGFRNFDININTNYEKVKIDFYDDNNNLIFNTNNTKLTVSGLSNKRYYCVINCEDDYSADINSKIITNQLLITFYINIDTVNPYGLIYDSFDKDINNTDTRGEYITFYGLDKNSGVNSIYLSYQLQPEILYTSGTKLYDSGEYRFRVVDNAGNESELYYTYMDHDDPILSIDKGFFYEDVYDDVTIKMTDPSISYIYCKKPNEAKYTKLNDKELQINETMSLGKYYFYAIDIYNNKTDEYWINYCGANELIHVNKVEDSNSVYLTWEDKLTVKLNGETYLKGEIISSEGNYIISITNSNGNIIKQDLQINCLYKEVEYHEATCIQEGYSIKQCISCGEIRYEWFGYGDHQFESQFIAPTCTEVGGTNHQCLYCDTHYMTDIIAPQGHDYVYEIIEGDCYRPRARIIMCYNCDYSVGDEMRVTGHSYVLLETVEKDGKCISIYMCENCMEIVEETEEIKTVEVIKLVDYLQNIYFPYLVWILLISVGIWSLIIGLRFIFLKKRNEIVETKTMIKNYILGLIAIFVLLVIIPLIIEAIASII